MESTRHAPHKCFCGEELDVASGRDGTRLRPGALTLCAYCGQLYQLGPNMEYVPKTIDDIPNMDPGQRVLLRQAQERLRSGEIRQVAHRARLSRMNRGS